MEKGIYTLVLSLSADQTVEVGSLGPVLFSKGYYAYTGSARGPGGLSRVERHISVMEGKNQTRRWHIDRSGAAHRLPLYKYESEAQTPITGATVAQTPGLDKLGAGRQPGIVRDGHVGDKGCVVGAVDGGRRLLL